jgi:hypothetical protein
MSRGQVHRHCIDGLSHNGQSGPFSDRYRDAVIDALIGCL